MRGLALVLVIALAGCSSKADWADSVERARFPEQEHYQSFWSVLDTESKQRANQRFLENRVYPELVFYERGSKDLKYPSDHLLRALIEIEIEKLRRVEKVVDLQE